MFILIGAAYRQIETDHNPLLREARKRAADTYEKGPSESNFKSRRPENRSESDKSFWDNDAEGGNH